MRATIAALACAVLLACAGCAKDRVEKAPLKLEDVPPEIMKVAKEKLPGVTITEAYKEGPNYELRGKGKNGKLREIDIAPDGTVVELD